MNKLEREEINALPKATGSLSAKTMRWPPSDPRNTIDTHDVFFRDLMPDYYDVGGRVEDGDYFTSVIFEIPKNIQSGEHDVGQGGIDARYNILLGEEQELYRAVSGKIKLSVKSEGIHFEAEDFHFVGRIGSAGRTVELILGKFSISR
ncbi:hypothetical protein [Pseudomonas brassicacearum]|uniref:Uncharacterized protein n=1 Tax=Pseudomonas brassicacearum TaxID=930166 RepID=A0A423JII1_9PSED|nr:hypothetical protein [Pseudomonas brassicacearum]RON37501.1 hypothetical protein BK664_17080 [Pseudomonas brassicacearum]